nr:hypothetical protein CFP56_70158 [Quercus suber]
MRERARTHQTIFVDACRCVAGLAEVLLDLRAYQAVGKEPDTVVSRVQPRLQKSDNDRVFTTSLSELSEIPIGRADWLCDHVQKERRSLPSCDFEITAKPFRRPLFSALLVGCAPLLRHCDRLVTWSSNQPLEKLQTVTKRCVAYSVGLHSSFRGKPNQNIDVGDVN